jgi:ABC-type Zn uptake system ZnuABC Zn-binding protein ZnuA
MRRFVIAVLAASWVSACAGPTTSPAQDGRVRVVTTSAVVADIVARVAGDAADVVSVIPNGFDSHTYEPRPSELELLVEADLIVVADATLNSGLTQLAVLSGDARRVLDLNDAGLKDSDLIVRDGSTGWNPHTWTDPNLVARWLEPLTQRLKELVPAASRAIDDRSSSYAAQLFDLDHRIKTAFDSVPAQDRKLVVYHDAWEYFGRRYGLEVVGALQAVNFAEPSAAELARMAKQLRDEQVPAFFGSEVFPSDVLEALEQSSGSRYVADLADDRLVGEQGDPNYGYLALMDSNLALLLEGLRR